jgi:hypothetical protein
MHISGIKKPAFNGGQSCYGEGDNQLTPTPKIAPYWILVNSSLNQLIMFYLGDNILSCSNNQRALN